MAGGIRLDKSDVERFIRIVREIKGEVKISGTQLVRELAEEIRDESVARAPVKTGALEISHTAQVVGTGGKIRAEVGFGPTFSKSGVDYSLLMHEGLDQAGLAYDLGPRSEDKSEGPPHRGKGVGMKFLKRAFDFVMRNIQTRAAIKIDLAISKAARKHGAKVL